MKHITRIIIHLLFIVAAQTHLVAMQSNGPSDESSCDASRFDDLFDEPCFKCFGTDSDIVLPCEHGFHHGCLMQDLLLKKDAQCPQCKQNIDKKTLVSLSQKIKNDPVFIKNYLTVCHDYIMSQHKQAKTAVNLYIQIVSMQRTTVSPKSFKRFLPMNFFLACIISIKKRPRLCHYMKPFPILCFLFYMKR
jgi:hypothetical protein